MSKEKKKCFLFDNEKIEGKLPLIKKWWYFILLFGSTIFVLCNFCCITEFTFFSNFNGRNLIFLVWLLLLVLPLFDNFEGFGVKLSSQKHKEAEKLKKFANELSEQTTVKTVEELQAEMGKEKGGSNE